MCSTEKSRAAIQELRGYLILWFIKYPRYPQNFSSLKIISPTVYLQYSVDPVSDASYCVTIFSSILHPLMPQLGVDEYATCNQ